MHRAGSDKEIRLALFIARLGQRLRAGINGLFAVQHHLNIGPLMVIFSMALGLRLGLRRADMAEPRTAFRLPASVIPGSQRRQGALRAMEDLTESAGQPCQQQGVKVTDNHCCDSFTHSGDTRTYLIA